MHSSRMRTSCSLTVCRSLLPRGLVGGCVWSRGLCLVPGVSAHGGGGCMLPGDLLPGGSAPRERCLLPRGRCLVRGVSAPGALLPGGCLPQGGVCPWGCLLLGGLLPGGVVCLLRGVSAPGEHVCSGCGIPPCEQNDKQVQKYYLGHNFVAAGNNALSFFLFLFQVTSRRMRQFNKADHAREESRNYQKTAQTLTLFIIAHIGQWWAWITFCLWSFFGNPSLYLVS